MGGALGLCGDADHAALVDLQHVRLQEHQALQTAAAETDVVDGDHQPRRAQRANRLDQVRRIADDLLLADLQRSEEHTSELQSQSNLVCRLLLEKKKSNNSGYNARCA